MAGQTKPFHMGVIGGGTGGLVSAAFAASLGLKVVLISDTPLGGECLYTGCVPSKALLHTASIVHQARQSQTYGLEIGGQVDFAAVMASVQQGIQAVAPHDSPDTIQNKYRVDTIIKGRARFTNLNTVQVNGKSIQAKKWVIATGGRPFIPSIDGLAKSPYLTHETLFDLKTQPKHLVLLGGGAVSVEMAQAFTRLGTRVTLIHRGNRLLKGMPDEASKHCADFLKAEGVTLQLNTTVKRVRYNQGNFILISLNSEQGYASLSGDTLLVATGKTPNTKLNLEAAGIAYTQEGISIDAQCRTSNKRVWAVGDVTGGRNQFTHYAEHQAKVAVTNAVLKIRKSQEVHWIPRVVYTEPEIAHIGQREPGPNDLSFVLEGEEVDRSLVEGEENGWFRVITNQQGHILGASIVGQQAGELLHPLAIAAQKKVSLDALEPLIYAYPSRSTAVSLLAQQYSSQKWLTGWRGAALKQWAQLS